MDSEWTALTRVICSGNSVSNAGDVNGDGFDDIIIGAWRASADGNYAAGESYVIFGKSSGLFCLSLICLRLMAPTVSALMADNLDDRCGMSVSNAGDVNGDGFDDIIMGAPNNSVDGVGYAGECYVVFGHSGSFSASLDLATLNGTNGFSITGVDPNDSIGYSVSAAGDINGDGFDDILVGDANADPGGDSSAGSTYVIFGKASGFSVSLNLANIDGSNGFRIDGIDAYDWSGLAISSAGDVNSDGFDDLLIAAEGASSGIGIDQGECYVVFGKSTGFTASFDLSTLNGLNGFRLIGVDSGDRSGFSVSAAGDVNGDGFDDIIISANLASPGGQEYAGESYVVFGKAAGFAAAIDLAALNGSDGFRIQGVAEDDWSGTSVSAAGDVNNDGFDDVIVSSPGTSSANLDTGATYVIFGRATAAITRVGSSVADRLFGGELQRHTFRRWRRRCDCRRCWQRPARRPDRC